MPETISYLTLVVSGLAALLAGLIYWGQRQDAGKRESEQRALTAAIADQHAKLLTGIAEEQQRLERVRGVVEHYKALTMSGAGHHIGTLLDSGVEILRTDQEIRDAVREMAAISRNHPELKQIAECDVDLVAFVKLARTMPSYGPGMARGIIDEVRNPPRPKPPA